MIRKGKQFKEILLSEEQEILLNKIGSWSIENLLRNEKRKLRKGKNGTKPSKYFLNKR
ncbi:MAG: hypothetical protein ACOCXT_06560 [Candidatus Dojkabacteria bacterium]